MAARVPSLREFMRQRDALRLFRDALRATRSMEPATRAETRRYVRHCFETSRHVTDGRAVAYLLAEGRMQLDNMLNSFNMTK
jgi:hypothetical protein